MQKYSERIKKLIEEDLIKMDEKFCSKRDKKRLKNVSTRKKSIFLCGYKLEIKRRYYLDTKENKHVFLLDEWLNIEKYQHFPKEEKEIICQMVVKEKKTFNQVKMDYKNKFSINTICHLIKNQPIEYISNFNTEPTKFRFIYIDVDDTYGYLKINNKRHKFKFKVLHIYQDYEKGVGFKNEIKAVFLNEVHLDSEKSMKQTINEIKVILNQYYGDLSNFELVVSGDGARYIKTIAINLESKLGLDKYHAYKRLHDTLKTSNLKKFHLSSDVLSSAKFAENNFANEGIQLLKEGKVDELNKQLVDFKNNYGINSKELNSSISYFKNNKNGIKIWNNPNYFGTYTETFVQQLVKKYFGDVGKCYSLNTFMNILKANCLVSFFN